MREVTGKMYSRIITENLTYGHAVDMCMHGGIKIARAHWDGYWEVGMLHHPKTSEIGGSCRMLVAVLRDGQGVAPATAYNEDMFARDWMIVE